jgi:NAD(P)-dependent dehydrogenase (short-subunit alcohol dehydrogenase family)
MLAQKVAVVTGAARGIGLAVARDLAASGCRVVMVGRGAEAIENAARELCNSGHQVIPHVADVTDASAVAALAARLRREFRRVDILINNAGVLLEPKDFAAPQGASVFVVDPELVTTTYTCNALAPLRLIQALVPLMRENGWGRIVNVSSSMGQLAEMGGFWPGIPDVEGRAQRADAPDGQGTGRQPDQDQLGLPRLVPHRNGRQGCRPQCRRGGSRHRLGRAAAR